METKNMISLEYKDMLQKLFELKEIDLNENPYVGDGITDLGVDISRYFTGTGAGEYAFDWRTGEIFFVGSRNSLDHGSDFCQFLSDKIVIFPANSDAKIEIPVLGKWKTIVSFDGKFTWKAPFSPTIERYENGMPVFKSQSCQWYRETETGIFPFMESPRGLNKAVWRVVNAFRRERDFDGVSPTGQITIGKHGFVNLSFVEKSVVFPSGEIRKWMDGHKRKQGSRAFNVTEKAMEQLEKLEQKLF